MPTGSCLCGAIQLSYTGEPVYQCICHCLDCRKITGTATGSCVFVVPATQLRITSGHPKTFTKTSDHGTQLTSHFCGDCGATLYREGGTKGPGMLSLRMGLLDDLEVVDDAKVQMELYVERRPKWVSEVEGAEQRNCRYELIEGVGKGEVEG